MSFSQSTRRRESNDVITGLWVIWIDRETVQRKILRLKHELVKEHIMTNSDSIVVTPGTELPFACASCFFCGLMLFSCARVNVGRAWGGWLEEL